MTTYRRTRACALLIGALAASCRPGEAAFASRAPEFDSARAWHELETLVGFGARSAGTPALERTRSYIEQELRVMGLDPKREAFKAKTPLGEFDMANVYVDLPGDSDAHETVILCTHFDTKRLTNAFVGANDGGSGTAVLLELARTLAARAPSAVAYRVLFLDGEEALRTRWETPDHTYGSRHHADGLEARGEAHAVRACVLLDMVGDRDLALLRERYSDRRLLDLFVRAAHAEGLDGAFAGEGIEMDDDHHSFMAKGIPSIDLIDFDYGPSNAYWHTDQDTLEHCSRQSLDEIGRIVLRGLSELESTYRRR